MQIIVCFCLCNTGANWCGTVVDWLERSACDAESTGSSIARPRQLLCRDVEQVLYTQLLCNTTASAPSRRVSALLSLSVRRAISKLSCIVFYCIVLKHIKTLFVAF